MENSYKNLLIWQRSIGLVTEIYKITDSYPKTEMYGLTSQTRRSALSMPANIAEGWSRRYTKEYIQFLHVARGSATELETHLIIASNLNFISASDSEILQKEITEILKMLSAAIASLRSNRTTD